MSGRYEVYLCSVFLCCQGDYHVDNSRSDLSDILEEEEEDFYSDHHTEAQPRGYTVAAGRVRDDVAMVTPHNMWLVVVPLVFSDMSFSSL